jgi:hypothetical protein
MDMSSWKVYAASAIGKGHIDGDLPCQDAFAYASGAERLVAVVCDGAGSASRSEVGAINCSRTICDFLAAFEGPPEAVCDRPVIEQAVEVARTCLASFANELALPIRELNCTLVGAVLYPKGGCLFHIGDGVGVAEFDGVSPLVSFPENGEYANETYFVTQDDWKIHLRVLNFTNEITSLALMSDGAMSFAFKRTGLFGPFMDPVKSYLATVSTKEGSEALKETLAGEGTWKITSDDKSLVLIMPGKNES